MLIVSRRLEARLDHDAELALPFELRRKSRLRTRLRSGEEVGLFLERGQILRNGDCLQAEDGRVVKVVAQPERVLHITCADAESLLRVTYHLGNRHVPLQVGKGWVRIVDDSVLRRMVEGLGATVEAIDAPFEPEAGAYGAHAHDKESSGPERGPVVHGIRDFRVGARKR